jgi:tyrosyl-tRNA synthetase
MSFLEEMQWRGLVSDATADFGAAVQQESLIGYTGFDPSAASLHVGSLLPLMCLARLQRAGHRPIALVGGGTGMIGDPSGKTAERQLLTPDDVDRNVAGLRSQIERFIDLSASSGALLIDNGEWLRSANLIAFLRDVGKHFSVSAMLAKDSVKRRLESETGISYTEFSYQLLQAYDFQVLHERFGCNLQMGGSDQWGNITAGIDLVRRTRGGKVHGLVFPLLLNAQGTKFGKTESGTVWLDAERTSPYRFYQFWLGSDDRDVVRLLKLFTWLDHGSIAGLEAELARAPEKREAQRTLARELTRMVHGDAALARAEHVSALFFSGDLAELSGQEVLDVVGDAPASDLAAARLEGDGIALADLLVESGVAKSKGEARRAIEGGGIYVRGERAVDPARKITRRDAIDGKLILLRKGRKDYHVVRLS